MSEFVRGYTTQQISCTYLLRLEYMYFCMIVYIDLLISYM